MKTLKLVGWSFLVGTAAVTGCRGSVDRTFFDDLDASVTPTGDASTSSSSSSSGGGDAGPRDATSDAPVTSVPSTIRGTVVGLTGTGLVLQNNGGDDLAVATGGGAIEFVKKVDAGQPYDITVRSQPSGPTQTCTVGKGKGTANGVDVTDVLVTCVTATYPVSGVVVGLEAGKTLVLTNNGANDITVTESGPFVFANNVASGSNFNVLVKTQPVGIAPPGCTVSGGTGTVVTSGVDTVVINCTPGTYTVGGTVTGLAGTLVVTDAVGNIDRTISANGAFAFPDPKANGTQYNVSVKTAPAWPPVNQTCTVQKGQGTVSGAIVGDIAIACTTTTYSVGGNLTGLAGGKTIVLTNNGGDDIALTADGAFAFATKIASGSNHDVVVKTQPAGTTCSISGGSGAVTTAPVSGIVVNCTPDSFTVGGNVTGLIGNVVLTTNGVDRLVNSNGNFSFPPMTSGTQYNVTVKTQPTWAPAAQTCVVVDGSGTLNGNVGDVKVTCTTNVYAVGGNISGLVGGGLVLRNNNENKSIGGPGPYTFDTSVASNSGYAVSVFTQPAGQYCSVAGASGVVRNGPIGNANVTCIGGVILAENFDSATSPGLPSGWTQDILSDPFGNMGWRTADDENRFKSAPNAAYIPNYDDVRDFAMVSPAFNVTTATAKVSFWQRYDLEEECDGGVLEIRYGGAAGTWEDFVAAGGSFTSGGYDCTIENGTSPLSNRSAWCGFKITTTVGTLPAAAMGQSVQLRWRAATDDGVQEDGWWVDDIVITNN